MLEPTPGQEQPNPSNIPVGGVNNNIPPPNVNNGAAAPPAVAAEPPLSPQAMELVITLKHFSPFLVLMAISKSYMNDYVIIVV